MTRVAIIVATWVRICSYGGSGDVADEFVRTEVEATPLADRITAEIYDAILRDARTALESSANGQGKAETP